MRVKILRSTIADRRQVRAGEVHDLPDADARTLLALGKAALAEQEPEPITTATVEAVVEVETKKPRGRRK